jgi:hypothetical protein
MIIIVNRSFSLIPLLFFKTTKFAQVLRSDSTCLPIKLGFTAMEGFIRRFKINKPLLDLPSLLFKMAQE